MEPNTANHESIKNKKENDILDTSYPNIFSKNTTFLVRKHPVCIYNVLCTYMSRVIIGRRLYLKKKMYIQCLKHR